MQRRTRLASLALAIVMASGCYGPFRLTRKVWEFNGQVGGKWANEVAFLVMYIIPVYGIAMLADGVIFNSVEFWTGNNLLADSAKGETTRQIARGDATATITKIDGPDGKMLVIEQFQKGQPAGTLRIQERDGSTVGTDAAGNTLFTAKAGTDGGIVISDAKGAQVAKYSPDQVEQFQKVAVR